MEKQRFSKQEYSKLPNEPGVYKFISKDGIIIYVGKAKSLIKRVSSYFTKASDINKKTQKLVQEINEIEFTIVNSEFDALLLENNLIKENQPKYNILLKDDKSFPSICITNERFPRIHSTRRIDKKLGEYFGPYTNVKAMNGVIDLIQKLYHIRTCNFNLSNKNISERKFKVCLEYHIGNCLGPCEGLQNEQDYLEEISSARKILTGQISAVLNEYKIQMNEAALMLNFELAQTLKTKIEQITNFQTKSLIVNPKLENLDVFGVVSANDNFYVNYMKIVHGAINITETIDFKKKIDTPDEEMLQSILFTIRKKYDSQTNEVLSNKQITSWDNLIVTQPKIGDKKKLLDLSLKNVLYFKQDIEARNINIQTKKNHVISQLQKDLNLKELPEHIECFDNSNIQGTNPVASMVCFRNGKPSKKDYRKYNIKTVIGPDDFLSMKEIVGRRYFKLKNENLPFPQLIIIDGGKGQLNAACDALKELGEYGSIPIIGIAKKLEEIYYPEDSFPLYLSKKSTSLKLIQQIRDEAHRFAVTFHRSKRSIAQTTSELDSIPGVGPSSKKLLFNKFHSIKRIKQLTQIELEEVVGKSKASLITNYFRQKKEASN
ncbi:MAG: excinuclease ABC subunit C [Cyclobacteriaceae bacterium]|jgi:excinuclease ABC subunit C